MLQDFVPADHATLVRNPNYFESGLPYLDGVKFVFLPDASTQVAALKSGTVDFLIELNPNQAQPLVGVSSITLVAAASTGFFNLRMRADRPPFNDNRVRQAMKLVVDRKAIANVVFGSRAVLGNDQPIAPAYKLWYSDIGIKPRDVPKAKALLAAAGYPKGLTVNLVNSPFVGGADYAVAYQQLAADANIDVKILTESGSDYFAKDWLQVNFGLTSWGARPAPNLLLNLLYKSGAVWNEGHYNNPKLDALIDAAGSEMKPARRKALYRQIELLISDEGPSIIPFYSTFVFPFSSKVRGFQPMSDTFHYYKTAWLSS
jgi:peptide/nickel transport system substrate-binding protein